MVTMWTIIGIIFVVSNNMVVGMLCFICASIFMAADGK